MSSVLLRGSNIIVMSIFPAMPRIPTLTLFPHHGDVGRMDVRGGRTISPPAIFKRSTVLTRASTCSSSSLTTNHQYSRNGGLIAAAFRYFLVLTLALLTKRTIDGEGG